MEPVEPARELKERSLTTRPSLLGGRTAEVDAAHSALLRAYHEVLREASLIGRSSEHPERSPGEGYAIRGFVHGHVKRRLAQMARIYGRAAATHEDGEDREWLDEKKRSCDALGGTLSLWWGPSAIAILPIAIGLVGLFVDDISLDFNDPLFYIVASLLLYVAYASMQLSGHFDKKRDLFKRGSRNVYVLEDDLFSRLGWGKPREFPSDLGAEAVGYAIAVLGVAILIDDLVIFDSLALITIIGLTACAAVLVGRRRLRERQR